MTLLRPLILAAIFLATMGDARPASAHEATPAISLASPPAVHSVKLVLLGTAGGPTYRPGVRVERSQPSSLLVVDGTPYLIDIGVGSMQRLAAAGYFAQDIGAVFITHHHLDHDGGLADFVGFSSFGQRALPVKIVGPAGTKEMVQAAIAFAAPWRRTFAAEGLVLTADPKSVFSGHDIQSAGLIFQDDRIKVFAAENSHYRFMPKDSLSFGVDRSYSYRIETPAGIIVFTGDTGPSDAVAELAQGVDILVSEVVDVDAAVQSGNSVIRNSPQGRQRIADHMRAEHLTPDEVGRLAARAGARILVLTHFAPGGDAETNEGYVQGISQFYHGPVIAGRDLTELDLSYPSVANEHSEGK